MSTLSLDKIKTRIPDYDVACTNWELIENACNAASCEDVYNLAGVCATVAVETALTFKPLEERGSDSYFVRNYFTNKRARESLGNRNAQDAVNYHGRGFIQLTGLDNYIAASDALNVNLVSQPQLACDAQTAARILVWFWTENKLNRLCSELQEARDPAHKVLIYQEVRRRVNGGLNGLALYMEILKELEVL
jgi:hypothetical protein